jgi:hypothetical protein
MDDPPWSEIERPQYTRDQRLSVAGGVISCQNVTSRSLLCAALLAVSALPTAAAAQQGRDVQAASEQAFVEALRREDPASAEKFIALRDAQQQALAELKKSEGRANAMPPELRVSLLPQLKQARRKYVESQLKILDFLDERDRKVIARLQEEMGRFNRELDERRKARDDLKKLLQE